ncbi:unnamed protein product [Cladocopium goreaui]|uniref:Calcium-dependent protein kinase 15 n=1 Tax=Cladocopium goreaui TaxID=2562237 RepID=A0A9P1D6H4_9DINO|nr:unnamed protein product [Cladocopium goreaui]|mmetsp:Transcript_40942/g.88715  ORF Transcript_40942/g.88715 Transcript_40942/m.88715 type:complete len:107 (+) Transcript_40942:67-387(+)
MDRMILSIFTGGGLCACCKPEMTSSVAMDILQLKSYQDEWDRTQRQMDLAKRDQQSKEQDIRDKAASRAAELAELRGPSTSVEAAGKVPPVLPEVEQNEQVITMNL